MITFIKLYWYTEQSLSRKNNYKFWNICYECEDLYAYCRSARLPAAIFIIISQIYLLVIVTSIQYKYKCGIQKIKQNRLTYTIIVLPTNSLFSFDEPKFCLRYSLFLYYSHSSITFRDKKNVDFSSCTSKCNLFIGWKVCTFILIGVIVEYIFILAHGEFSNNTIHPVNDVNQCCGAETFLVGSGSRLVERGSRIRLRLTAPARNRTKLKQQIIIGLESFTKGCTVV